MVQIGQNLANEFYIRFVRMHLIGICGGKWHLGDLLGSPSRPYHQICCTISMTLNDDDKQEACNTHKLPKCEKLRKCGTRLCIVFID